MRTYRIYTADMPHGAFESVAIEDTLYKEKGFKPEDYFLHSATDIREEGEIDIEGDCEDSLDEYFTVGGRR